MAVSMNPGRSEPLPEPGSFEDDWRDIQPGLDRDYQWVGLLHEDGKEVEGKGYERYRIPANWTKQEVEFKAGEPWGVITAIGIFFRRCRPGLVNTIRLKEPTKVEGKPEWYKEPYLYKFTLTQKPAFFSNSTSGIFTFPLSDINTTTTGNTWTINPSTIGCNIVSFT